MFAEKKIKMEQVQLNEKEIAILSILVNGDSYGYEIVKVANSAGFRLMLGGLYNLMKRLDKKGFVTSYWGEETEERGGSRRRYYKITGAGEEAFLTARAIYQNLFNLNLSS